MLLDPPGLVWHTPCLCMAFCDRGQHKLQEIVIPIHACTNVLIRLEDFFSVSVLVDNHFFLPYNTTDYLSPTFFVHDPGSSNHVEITERYTIPMQIFGCSIS